MVARPGKNLVNRRPRKNTGLAAPSTAGERPITLRRTAKGTRPEFFEDPAIDQLFAIVTALAAEASVTFDRIDTLERLLEQQGALASGAVEAYRPGDDAIDSRRQRREELLQRVFAVFEHSGPRRAR
jgi:hypothetical protein